MILESHSLKTAFTRFHLTTPEVLRELKSTGEVDRANAQIKALESQLAVIDRFQASDYGALTSVVGFPEGTVAANGGAPTNANGTENTAATPAAVTTAAAGDAQP